MQIIEAIILALLLLVLINIASLLNQIRSMIKGHLEEQEYEKHARTQRDQAEQEFWNFKHKNEG